MADNETRFNSAYKPRHERLQDVLWAIGQHTKQYYPIHAGCTMYDVAHRLGLRPSSHLMSMLKELQREGLLDGYTVIHRVMNGRENVEKIFWYLPEYPPVKQAKMDGF